MITSEIKKVFADILKPSIDELFPKFTLTYRMGKDGFIPIEMFLYDVEPIPVFNLIVKKDCRNWYDINLLGEETFVNKEFPLPMYFLTDKAYKYYLLTFINTFFVCKKTNDTLSYQQKYAFFGNFYRCFLDWNHHHFNRIFRIYDNEQLKFIANIIPEIIATFSVENDFSQEKFEWENIYCMYWKPYV
jgi:hypothetical protein